MLICFYLSLIFLILLIKTEIAESLSILFWLQMRTLYISQSYETGVGERNDSVKQKLPLI